VERLMRLGVTADYTRLWWDIRPHPRFGTLEVRMPDQPTRLELCGAFAALLQALTVTVLQRPERAFDASARGVYQQNRWAAARFGLGAELVHPDAERAAQVPALADELLSLAGRAARELGAAELLAVLDSGRTEGDRQLAIGRADGLVAVCADLVDRTVG
jgi:carboxylate-amine ligase